jgi:acetyltransferase-like isoleucine patch superfamily enzyme
VIGFLQRKLRGRRLAPHRLAWEGLHWARATLAARLWLRACDEVGADTKAFGRPHVENRGRIRIGARVRLSSSWAPLELATGPLGELVIGDGVFLNYGSLLSAQLSVRIGAGVMVGNYSIIADTEIPGIGDPIGGPGVEPRPVIIEDRAWLAARVTVLPGARIGEGAIIAAGSVVAGEIPAGAIAGGIPARVLRPTPGRAEAATAPAAGSSVP